MAGGRFDRAAVIGTGMMGPGIALTLALGGVWARIISRSEATAREGLAKAHAQLGILEAHGLVTPEQSAFARESLTSGDDLEDSARHADLIIESAPEDMAFKQSLFAQLDTLAPPETILASNTSGLSITEIASQCAHPERVMTSHFWNPPHIMPLVEIVRGEKTDPALAEQLRTLLTQCGKAVVMVKKDRPGQLGNRLQMALWREAVYIAQEGIADVEDIDMAAKLGFGLRLPVYGMFEHADMVGLPLANAVMTNAARDLYNLPSPPVLISQKIEAGETGVSTGRGFYDWTKRDATAVRERRDAFVLDFLKHWR
ncbi:MAG: 3-hydroxyacyl-CoA dehydrogenase family protein [Bryobacterales bacterium]|nr:3-hydroxyacyl-CoA dehydrogenase family protein [Bryobacterales bacterium]